MLSQRGTVVVAAVAYYVMALQIHTRKLFVYVDRLHTPRNSPLHMG